ncbi:F-box domain-containing protein [Hirschfeldia incana]|nr:F-box domain-containing protein [Hirschfeldia incana]
MRSPKLGKREEAATANWSNLCLDVIQMVLEKLSATDFNRAKAVCSGWLSASRQSVRKQNQIPWLILFPYERSYGYSCRMLNPAEKGLVYRSRNLGVEFTQSRCVATCGSWLLMYLVHGQPKLYILNPLTRDRINLPPLESRICDIIFSPQEVRRFCLGDQQSRRERALTEEEMSDLSSKEEKSVLWVDERSKNYLVVWSHGGCCLFFSKKGDNVWRMFPYVNGLWDFVCKGLMLYMYTRLSLIEIYDFSGDSPVSLTHAPFPFSYPPRFLSAFIIHRIAVTTSGEALMVRIYNIHKTSRSFYVYKKNHATNKWDEMASLGDQALIVDLGITVSAKDVQGFKSNSIYFSGVTFGTSHIFIYSLATHKVEPFMASTNKFFDARWFIPDV